MLRSLSAHVVGALTPCHPHHPIAPPPALPSPDTAKEIVAKLQMLANGGELDMSNKQKHRELATLVKVCSARRAPAHSRTRSCTHGHTHAHTHTPSLFLSN